MLGSSLAVPFSQKLLLYLQIYCISRIAAQVEREVQKWSWSLKFQFNQKFNLHSTRDSIVDICNTWRNPFPIKLHFFTLTWQPWDLCFANVIRDTDSTLLSRKVDVTKILPIHVIFLYPQSCWYFHIWILPVPKRSWVKSSNIRVWVSICTS